MYDHLNFIHQQLTQREIQIELQLFVSVASSPAQNRYEISAYNELLFLTNAQSLPAGTRIISDTNSLEISSDQSSMEALEEFSGLVVIELPDPCSQYPVFEFIQIVKA